MLSKKILDILNIQVEKEGYSSQLYLSMASWAEVKGFQGISEWLYVQSEEERTHMLKIIKYINERQGHAIIPEIGKPPAEFENIRKVFEAVLEHEQYISKSINEIVALCIEEKDYTTHNWIQWFVNEQIEEEASANLLLDKLKIIGDSGLYLFDRDIMSLRSGEAEG